MLPRMNLLGFFHTEKPKKNFFKQPNNQKPKTKKLKPHQLLLNFLLLFDVLVKMNTTNDLLHSAVVAVALSLFYADSVASEGSGLLVAASGGGFKASPFS